MEDIRNQGVREAPAPAVYLPGALLERAAALTGAGVVLGLAASAATSRLIAGQLWNVTPHDRLTVATAVSVLVAVALAACVVPARRAMRVEPMTALRRD